MRPLFACASALVIAVLSVPALAAGKPEIGSFGVDVAGMDRQVAPGDDFDRHVNGRWLDTTAIPDDRSYTGAFVRLDDLSRERTRQIIEEAARAGGAPGSNGRKVGDFYASFMDQAGIEAKGLEPLKPWLAQVDAIATPADLARTMGRLARIGVGLPIGAGVGTDDKNPDAAVATISQSGLALPDRDYYLDRDNPRFAAARAAYEAYATQMFRLAGRSDPEARARAILALETKIAQAHWTQVESRQAEKLYNPVARADLVRQFPGLDWATMLGEAGLAGEQRLIVSQPSAIAGTAQLLASEPLAVWKDYLLLRTLGAAASVLPKAFDDTSFALSKALTGQQVQRDRWKRGVDATTGALGEAAGQIYVDRYFPPEAKKQADELVKNIIAAMDARLANLDWMDAKTRTVAREKLRSFRPKIGYPDKWRDYGGLTVVRGDALGNRFRAAEFEWNRDLGKLGKPLDRDEWYMTPMTVNAYANPVWNEIVFPAAILQAPFFDPNADPAVNYGAIGAVIGHEITHHFDDQGRKYDKTGRLADWWTPQDVERFEARARKLVDQYAAYEPLPGRRINGELTLGENIADIAGLAVAHDAWRRSLGGAQPPVIDGFTGEQRFFLGFGQAWRGKDREQMLLLRLTSDPHSPDAYRAQTVRNFDPWYGAFGVKPGQKLFLTPGERVRIW